MEMRAATALMGHMGLELNLLTERAADLDMLKKAIDLHKKHRALLHEGDLYRLDSAAQLIASGVVARDKSEAFYSLAYVASDAQVLPGRLKFDGLDPERPYRLQLIWPINWQAVKGPSAIETLNLTGDGAIFSGAALMQGGLQLPHAFPETCLLFYLAAI
jgi:alpha-galactosidase